MTYKPNAHDNTSAKLECATVARIYKKDSDMC